LYLLIAGGAKTSILHYVVAVFDSRQLLYRIISMPAAITTSDRAKKPWLNIGCSCFGADELYLH
jgi:hypothetical protein